MSVERGTMALLVRRREMLAQSAEPIGWKVGFNVPAGRRAGGAREPSISAQEKLGIDAPLAGFLLKDGILEDGSEVSLGDGPRVVESEVAVEIGEDASTIVALFPALELADPPDLTQDLETILAGNIFHQGVAFGPRVETGEPGAGRILVNGEPAHELSTDDTHRHLEAMVAAVAARLEAAGERLSPGEIVITGILAPPHSAEPGDVVRLELDALGGVELRFTE